MSVVVFPMPEGAKKHPLAPGVCGYTAGGVRKFQCTSAGLFKAIVFLLSLAKITDLPPHLSPTKYQVCVP
jgi:hypothetical protein